MKKKVLFMIDSLTCGGAEKSLVSLLPLLNYDKVDVASLSHGILNLVAGEQVSPSTAKLSYYGVDDL